MRRILCAGQERSCEKAFRSELLVVFTKDAGHNVGLVVLPDGTMRTIEAGGAMLILMLHRLSSDRCRNSGSLRIIAANTNDAGTMREEGRIVLLRIVSVHTNNGRTKARLRRPVLRNDARHSQIRGASQGYR